MKRPNPGRGLDREAVKRGEPDAVIAEGRRVVEVEAAALSDAAQRLGASFADAVELIHAADGRVIVSGIGKSGTVGRKIAGTLTSTGTPAIFLHPVEGLHGDLGLIGPSDVALVLSKSGATEELRGLIDYLARTGVPMVALTGSVDSEVGRSATVSVDCSVTEEACPMDLAPTSSTAVQMAVGDALAVALLLRKGFREEDFARLHPGGALGRRLTLRVKDVMDTSEYPSLPAEAVIRDAIVPLARRRGTVPVVDGDGALQGVLTAGDLTRLMERREDFLEVPVVEVMTATPKIVAEEDLAARAVRIMETHGIMALPVVDERMSLKGVVHLHDLMRARVV